MKQTIGMRQKALRKAEMLIKRSRLKSVKFWVLFESHSAAAGGKKDLIERLDSGQSIKMAN